MVLKSYAKINIFLLVKGLRKDGYHQIKTLFERIDLCDLIIIKPRRDKKIKIISNSSDVPIDSSNLAFRSARLLQKEFKINQGVDIKINKRIPVGAGLGGGSSNAAYVLLGLNKLWKLNLATSKLASYAKKIGSDVAFFVYNCRFAEGCGRGDKIKPLVQLKNLNLWHVLVVPKLHVSTPLIYKGWDRLIAKKAGLTHHKYNVKILPLALRKKYLTGTSIALFNSLEPVTFSLYPQVERVKKRLLELGLKFILMSGSGPAVMGVVSSRKEGQSLARRLRQENRFWRVFVTKTV